MSRNFLRHNLAKLIFFLGLISNIYYCEYILNCYFIDVHSLSHCNQGRDIFVVGQFWLLVFVYTSSFDLCNFCQKLIFHRVYIFYIFGSLGVVRHVCVNIKIINRFDRCSLDISCFSPTRISVCEIQGVSARVLRSKVAIWR